MMATPTKRAMVAAMRAVGDKEGDSEGGESDGNAYEEGDGGGEMRVFSFLLAVTEVNAFLAYRFFCRPDPVPTLQQFRHKLAWELIKNKWLAKEDLDESHVVSMVHQLMVAPNNATKYANGRWLCNAKQPHQNYPCSFKQCGKPPKRIKTYCSCCPKKWICKFCHAAHVVSESELKRE